MPISHTVTLEQKIDRAIALLAAMMKKGGIRSASGFVPNPTSVDSKSRLDELLQSEPPAHSADPAQPTKSRRKAA